MASVGPPLWHKSTNGENKLTNEQLEHWIKEIRSDIDSGKTDKEFLWKRHWGFGVRYPQLYKILCMEDCEMNKVQSMIKILKKRDIGKINEVQADAQVGTALAHEHIYPLTGTPDKKALKAAMKEVKRNLKKDK